MKEAKTSKVYDTYVRCTAVVSQCTYDAAIFVNFLSLFLSVCQKIYPTLDLKEDFVECRDHLERVCSGQVCRKIKKKRCEVKQRQVPPRRALPKVTCEAKPHRICGFESCPLVKNRFACRNTTKYVSCTKLLFSLVKSAFPNFVSYRAGLNI